MRAVAAGQCPCHLAAYCSMRCQAMHWEVVGHRFDAGHAAAAARKEDGAASDCVGGGERLSYQAPPHVHAWAVPGDPRRALLLTEGSVACAQPADAGDQVVLHVADTAGTVTRLYEGVYAFLGVEDYDVVHLASSSAEGGGGPERRYQGRLQWAPTGDTGSAEGAGDGAAMAAYARGLGAALAHVQYGCGLDADRFSVVYAREYGEDAPRRLYVQVDPGAGRRVDWTRDGEVPHLAWVLARLAYVPVRCAEEAELYTAFSTAYVDMAHHHGHGAAAQRVLREMEDYV